MDEEYIAKDEWEGDMNFEESLNSEELNDFDIFRPDLANTEVSINLGVGKAGESSGIFSPGALQFEGNGNNNEDSKLYDNNNYLSGTGKGLAIDHYKNNNKNSPAKTVTTTIAEAPGKGEEGNIDVSAPPRTLNDLYSQIEQLKRDNFSLKLRLFHMSQNFSTEGSGNFAQSREEIIDLKVKNEELLQEISERNDLLIQARDAVDILQGELDIATAAKGGDVDTLKEEHYKQQQKLHDMEKELRKSVITIAEKQQQIYDLSQTVERLNFEGTKNVNDNSAILHNQKLEISKLLKKGKRDALNLTALKETIERDVIQIKQFENQAIEDANTVERLLLTIQEHKGKINHQESALEENGEELKRMRNAIKSMERRIGEQQDEITYLENTRGEVKNLQTTLESLRSENEDISQIRKENLELRKNERIMKATIEEFKEEIAIFQKSDQTLRETIKKHREEIAYEVGEKEKLSEELNAQVADLSYQLEMKNADIHVAMTKLEGKTRLHKKAIKDNETLELSQKKLSEENSALCETIQSQDTVIGKYKVQREDLNASLTKSEEKLAMTEEKFQETENKLKKTEKIWKRKIEEAISAVEEKNGIIHAVRTKLNETNYKYEQSHKKLVEENSALNEAFKSQDAIIRKHKVETERYNSALSESEKKLVEFESKLKETEIRLRKTENALELKTDEAHSILIEKQEQEKRVHHSKMTEIQETEKRVKDVEKNLKLKTEEAHVLTMEKIELEKRAQKYHSEMTKLSEIILLNKNAFISKDETISDLKRNIYNLEDEISKMKEEKHKNGLINNSRDEMKSMLENNIRNLQNNLLEVQNRLDLVSREKSQLERQSKEVENEQSVVKNQYRILKVTCEDLSKKSKIWLEERNQFEEEIRCVSKKLYEKEAAIFHLEKENRKNSSRFKEVEYITKKLKSYEADIEKMTVNNDLLINELGKKRDICVKVMEKLDLVRKENSSLVNENTILRKKLRSDVATHGTLNSQSKYIKPSPITRLGDETIPVLGSSPFKSSIKRHQIIESPEKNDFFRISRIHEKKPVPRRDLVAPYRSGSGELWDTAIHALQELRQREAPPKV